MLNGTDTVFFKSSKPKEQVHQEIENVLQSLGSVSVSDRGLITVSGQRFSNPFVDASFEGRVATRNDGYHVELTYSVKYPLLVWILVVCFGITLVGFAALIPGFLAKSDMSKRVERCLGEIKDVAS